jgi:3-hydroxyacyl-CoA dehydrogenase
MRLEAIRVISVLGAGIMGHGIAQSFLMGGYPVVLYDIQESILQRARSNIGKNLGLFLQASLIEKREIELFLTRLTTTTDIKRAVGGSEFIVEAATEDLELKQGLFEQVESFCKKEAILASNTSSLTLAEMGLRVKNKERLVTTHWFNPPHIVPMVEVVKGEETSDDTVETAYRLLAKIKKVPVKINLELPGFLINRIQIALYREVFDLYEKGVASAEDIDRAVKGSFGFRLACIGPLRTADLAGLDLWLKSTRRLLPEIENSIDPPKILQQLVAQGHYGIKSGKGFYEYGVDRSSDELFGAVQKRDRELLNLLKNLYGQNENEK